MTYTITITLPPTTTYSDKETLLGVIEEVLEERRLGAEVHVQENDE